MYVSPAATVSQVRFIPDIPAFLISKSEFFSVDIFTLTGSLCALTKVPASPHCPDKARTEISYNPSGIPLGKIFINVLLS